jgi:starvation-inducible DNA-binding protein
MDRPRYQFYPVRWVIDTTNLEREDAVMARRTSNGAGTSSALLAPREREPDGTLRPSLIDLPEESRRETVILLNARLADGVTLLTQCKQAHWNVRGPTFSALHQLFDAVYADVEACVDLIAERIVQLGGIAEGTAAIAVARSSLSPYPLTIASGAEHLQSLAAALAIFARGARLAIDEMDLLHDAVSADILTEVTRRMDRQRWMVEAHF